MGILLVGLYILLGPVLGVNFSRIERVWSGRTIAAAFSLAFVTFLTGFVLRDISGRLWARRQRHRAPKGGAR